MTANPAIDDLLERAVRAINEGDRATADALAGQVLAVDRTNPDAEELLTTPVGSGEIRRLTVLFADLVDSTALSMRIEPEVYRTVVGRYRDEVRNIVARYEGHIGSIKGDGLLAVFGHPKAHEDDTHRSVLAGLDIIREVADLSARAERHFGFDIDVRVGIHRGVVFLDIDQDDVYGLGANLAARICSLAQPGTVSVSAAVERLVHDNFDMAECPPQQVKGMEGPLVHHRVIAEHDLDGKTYGPIVGREQELAALREMWDQASAGTLTTRGVLLRGEGGIGKSRLASAAVDMARESGATVLELFGSPFHTDIGLRPVRRLIERHCRIQRDSDAGGQLAPAGSGSPEPLVGRRYSRAAAGTGTRHHSRRRIPARDRQCRRPIRPDHRGGKGLPVGMCQRRPSRDPGRGHPLVRRGHHQHCQFPSAG